MKRPLAVVLSCALFVACGDSVKDPPRITGPFVPLRLFVLSGFVRDENGGPVAGAIVEIASNPFTTRNTITDATGSFSIDSVTGQMTVRASRDGYSSFVQTVVVTTNYTLDVRLARLPELAEPDSLRLGTTIESSVLAGARSCDPNWDAEAPCRRFQLTAPATGTLVVAVSWNGGPELDATIVTAGNRYVGTSTQHGPGAISVVAPVTIGERYEVRVNSYYSGQTFTLRADLKSP